MKRASASEPAPLHLGALLAASGGFLDAFTFVGHGGVFANAMTGNVVLTGVDVLQGNVGDVGRHLPAILAFLLGVFTAQAILSARATAVLRRPRLVCLGTEIIFVGAAAWYPAAWYDLPLIIGIAYVAAIQNSAFTKLGPWSFNSVVTTGNLRHFAESLFHATVMKDRGESAAAASFGAICLCFFLGAAIGAACTPPLGNHALLVADLALVTAWIAIWRLSPGMGIASPRASSGGTP
jgi:uncharacterized membrane protein YoaK (UPF0700 family)